MEDGRNIIDITSTTKRIRSFLILGLCFLGILLSSCSSPIDALDFDSFTQLPNISTIDFNKISPDQSYTYWELRQAEVSKATIILGSGGKKTKAQLSDAERTALNSMTSDTGFNIGCQGQGGYCYKYIVTLSNGVAKVLNTTLRIGTFLSSIDSLAEAALLASAHGYIWEESSLEAGSYIERIDGYEMIVLRLINLCLPVQTDRFHITVTADTTINVIHSETWQAFPDNCIQQE